MTANAGTFVLILIKKRDCLGIFTVSINSEVPCFFDTNL